jgi:hippurate hydrolase
MEKKTAKRLAEAIRAVGFTVTEHIGGTGIFAILKNGPGSMVMVRADMDGLPVVEMSGLKSASKVTTKSYISSVYFSIGAHLLKILSR